MWSNQWVASMLDNHLLSSMVGKTTSRSFLKLWMKPNIHEYSSLSNTIHCIFPRYKFLQDWCWMVGTGYQIQTCPSWHGCCECLGKQSLHWCTIPPFHNHLLWPKIRQKIFTIISYKSYFIVLINTKLWTGYHVGQSIDQRSSIHYVQLVRLCICVHDGLYVVFILSISAEWRPTHKGLGRAGDGGLALGVDPG